MMNRQIRVEKIIDTVKIATLAQSKFNVSQRKMRLLGDSALVSSYSSVTTG